MLHNNSKNDFLISEALREAWQRSYIDLGSYDRTLGLGEDNPRQEQEVQGIIEVLLLVFYLLWSIYEQ